MSIHNHPRTSHAVAPSDAWSRSLKTSIGLVAVFLSIGLTASAAEARRPSATWTLPSSADAGSAVPYTWTAQRLKTGTVLVVQRQEGTAHSWHTVIQLGNRSSGSGQLPGMPLGRYRLRVAALGSRGRALAQQVHGLNVYGQVPFSSLFGPREGGSGVYTTPTHTFPYVISGDDNFSDGVAVIADPHNNCRSVHIEFMASSVADAQGVVTVVQETLDPASASAPINSVGSLDAPVVPGHSWSVNLSQTGGAGYYLHFYLAGSASCDSP
jgi:hypothetical protein